MFYAAILACLHQGFASSTFATAAVLQCDPRAMCGCLPEVSAPLDETGFLQLGAFFVQARDALGNRSRDSESGSNDLAETARVAHVYEDARLDRVSLAIQQTTSQEVIITRSLTHIATSLSQIQTQTRNIGEVLASKGGTIMLLGILAFVVGLVLSIGYNPMPDSGRGLYSSVENTFENEPSAEDERDDTGRAKRVTFAPPPHLEGDRLDPKMSDNPEKFFVLWNALKSNPRGESFVIMRVKGMTMLDADMVKHTGQSLFSISSQGCQKNPIMTVLSRGTDGTQLVFRSSTHPYGILEAREPSQHLLVCEGRPVFRVELLDNATLQLTVTSQDGERLGTGHHVVGRVGIDIHQEYWRADVKAGRDEVLIVGCMLAVILQAAREDTSNL